jgi:hypothetical protein
VVSFGDYKPLLPLLIAKTIFVPRRGSERESMLLSTIVRARNVSGNSCFGRVELRGGASWEVNVRSTIYQWLAIIFVLRVMACDYVYSSSS